MEQAAGESGLCWIKNFYRLGEPEVF